MRDAVTTVRAGLLAGAVGILGPWAIPPALAQNQSAPSATPAPAPAPNPDSPERITAQFGDWGMLCIPRPANVPGQPAPGGRLCEISQTAQNQQQQPVSRLALGRTQRIDPLKMVVQLPPIVLVNTPVRMVFEGNEAAISMPWRACLPQPPSCFAEIELRDEALVRRLRTRTAEQGARLEWRDPAGNPQQVPVSFRGFAAALDALQREGN